jgi:hypothetical protein
MLADALLRNGSLSGDEIMGLEAFVDTRLRQIASSGSAMKGRPKPPLAANVPATPPHGGAQSSPQARLRAVPIDAATKCTKDGRKLDDEQRMPGAGLS